MNFTQEKSHEAMKLADATCGDAIGGASRPMTIEEELDEMFGRHRLDSDQEMRSNIVRMAARSLGQVILQAVPPCADRTAAIRHLRLALMTANSAISHRGAI